MQFRAGGLYHQEMTLQIMRSVWARRLWAVPEGARQSVVCYQFAESIQTFDSFSDRAFGSSHPPDQENSISAHNWE
jgi:hypothetical protein